MADVVNKLVEKIKDFEAVPPENAWENIESQLPATFESILGKKLDGLEYPVSEGIWAGISAAMPESIEQQMQSVLHNYSASPSAESWERIDQTLYETESVARSIKAKLWSFESEPAAYMWQRIQAALQVNNFRFNVRKIAATIVLVIFSWLVADQWQSHVPTSSVAYSSFPIENADQGTLQQANPDLKEDIANVETPNELAFVKNDLDETGVSGANASAYPTNRLAMENIAGQGGKSSHSASGNSAAHNAFSDNSTAHNSASGNPMANNGSGAMHPLHSDLAGANSGNSFISNDIVEPTALAAIGLVESPEINKLYKNRLPGEAKGLDNIYPKLSKGVFFSAVELRGFSGTFALKGRSTDKSTDEGAYFNSIAKKGLANGLSMHLTVFKAEKWSTTIGAEWMRSQSTLLFDLTEPVNTANSSFKTLRYNTRPSSLNSNITESHKSVFGLAEDVSISDSIVPGSQYRLVSNFAFLHIPINLSANLISKKRFGLDLTAGVGFSLISLAESYQPGADRKSMVVIYSGQYKEFYQSALSGNLGLAISYSVSRKTAIVLRPEWRQSLTPISRNNEIVKIGFQTYGLNLGLSHQF